jgi:hypothetical protein
MTIITRTRPVGPGARILHWDTEFVNLPHSACPTGAVHVSHGLPVSPRSTTPSPENSRLVTHDRRYQASDAPQDGNGSVGSTVSAEALPLLNLNSFWPGH